MIICELAFNEPDPKTPEYSLYEIELYSYIPYVSQQKHNMKNHSLTLRKNLRTNMFELVRHYPDTDTEELVYTGSFEEALAYANKQFNKYWSGLGQANPYKPCRHKPPQIDALMCPELR
jgi:hypothetical protein